MKKFSAMLATPFVLLIASCGQGGSGGGSEPIVTTEFDGSRPSLQNIYTPEQIDALEEIGLIISLGDQPPNIEGQFRFAPAIVQASSVPDEAAGFEVSSSNITFSNQDNDSLTVDLEVAEDVEATTTGTGSFISGSGQAFTVFFITESEIEGFLADTTTAISAIVGTAGLENIQVAFFILDDRGDPDDVFIPENTGRLIIDEDGFSERLTTEDTLLEKRSTIGVNRWFEQ